MSQAESAISAKQAPIGSGNPNHSADDQDRRRLPADRRASAAGSSVESLSRRPDQPRGSSIVPRNVGVHARRLTPLASARCQAKCRRGFHREARALL